MGPTLTSLSSTAAASLSFPFPFLSLPFSLSGSSSFSALRCRPPAPQSSPIGPLLLRPTPMGRRALAPRSSPTGPLLLRLAPPSHLSAPGPRHLPARLLLCPAPLLRTRVAALRAAGLHSPPSRRSGSGYGEEREGRERMREEEGRDEEREGREKRLRHCGPARSTGGGWRVG